MDCMTEVIVKVINIVMKLAPLGLGCYFAILIGQYGDRWWDLSPEALSCTLW